MAISVKGNEESTQQEQPSGKRPLSPTMRTLRAVLIGLGLFLLYAYAVTATEIDLTNPLDARRQDNLIRVLQQLADPDFFSRDEATGQLMLSEAVRLTGVGIVETIFMALLASTIGTLLAVPLSFIAARNLMENVASPLAAIMSGVIALPIGIFLGSQVGQLLLGLVGISGSTLLTAIALLAVAGLIVAARRFAPDPTSSGPGILLGRLAALLLLSLAAIALAAQIGRFVGPAIDTALGPFGFLGNFITVLSDFVQLLLPAILGLLFGLVAISLGSRFGQESIIRLPTAPARVLTGILAGVGTAVIVYGVGSALNWLYLFDNPASWTTIPAGIGGAIGLIVGLVVAPKRPFPIGFIIYTLTRSLLNILRSIEPLIMGIVFVVWVSLGPFAGVMALTLHSIAALGKLFSEQVEGIDDGPIEALTATGANRLQTIVYAVIPQIVPPYLAFALYRWDINVRMATIIGFVGGGGIGLVLSQNIQLLRYRQASVMMLAIAVVVAVLDYVSARIRSRII